MTRVANKDNYCFMEVTQNSALAWSFCFWIKVALALRLQAEWTHVSLPHGLQT